MQTIMLIGVDQSLLRTRAAVLARTGSKTICASVSEALRMQEQCRADLAVICHTVPEPLRSALVRTLHDRWPETRVLVVLGYEECSVGVGMSSADAVSSTLPDRLLRRTAELLGGRARPAFRTAEPTAPVYMH